MQTHPQKVQFSGLLLLLCSLLALAAPARGTTITFEIANQTVTLGSSANATIGGEGSLGLHNDFAASSQTAAGPGIGQKRTLSLGTVKKAGMYRVRAFGNGIDVTYVVQVIAKPGAPNTFDLIASLATVRKSDDLPASPGNPPISAPDLWKKYCDGIEANNFAVLKDAAKKAASKYATENAVAISGTFTICIVATAPSPVQLVALDLCIADAADQFAGYGAETLSVAATLLKDSGKLTAREADAIKTVVSGLRTIGKALTIKSTLDALMVGADAAVDLGLSDRPDSKFVIKSLGIDSIHKYRMLLDLKPR